MKYKQAEKTFKEFINKYDKTNVNIQRKINHSYGVSRKSKYLAKKLKLDKENIELAKMIGLIHDIGRFEQEKIMKTFVDSDKFDHAKYACELLFENNMIRKFIEEEKYDKIIKTAIENHNKLKIDEGLTENELLHAKIIRDADKLDNFRIRKSMKLDAIFENCNSISGFYEEKISEKVYKDFMEHKSICKKDIKTFLDQWICLLAFIYDFNFDESLKFVKNKKYIDILVKKIKIKDERTKSQMEEIRKEAKEYINEKCNNKL